VSEIPPRARVLVVDDDGAICSLLHAGLISAGFESFYCTSGSDALSLLNREQFDAVVSDLNMPAVTGFDLLEATRRNLPHAAFLMATGVSDVNVGIAAMKKGAADYLLKPFQLDAVIASLDRALRVKRLETELEDYRKHLEAMVELRTQQLEVAWRQTERAYEDVLQALAATLDLRDYETAGHSRRVVLYAMEIAKVMGHAEELSKALTWGGALHDIGKMAVPDSILLKPSELTPEETATMQSHVQIGYQLIGQVMFLAPAAQIVLTHHERFDGEGYPQGLAGEEIPLGARIFSVADTLDALRSDRPYRCAQPFAVAREIIQKESGKQFDPKVVEAFLAISEETWEQVRREATTIHLNGQSTVSPATGTSQTSGVG